MRRHSRTVVTVRWCLPNDAECVVDIALYPAERRVMYDANGEGYPGSPASAEIRDAVVIENGTRRRLTDEEYEWLDEAEAEIEDAAFDRSFDEEEEAAERRFSDWKETRDTRVGLLGRAGGGCVLRVVEEIACV